MSEENKSEQPAATETPRAPAEEVVASTIEALTPSPVEAPPAETPAPEPPKEPVHPPVLLGRCHDISPFASTDETRWILNGVHYNPKGFIEATDGKMLIRVQVHPLSKDDGFPAPVNGHAVADDCTIPTAEFKKGLARLTANGDKKASMVSCTADGEQQMVCKVIDGNYPNTEQVLPKDPSKWQIALSPHLLQKVAAYAAKHVPEKFNSMKLEGWDELSAVRITFQVDDPRGIKTEAMAILMPMRLS